MAKVRLRRNQSRRGMALAMIMMVLFVIMTATLLGEISTNLGRPQTNSGLIYTGSNSTTMAQARMARTSAFNLADAGIEYTLEWLSEQPFPPANTSAFSPAIWGSTAVGTPTRSVVSYGSVGQSAGQFSVEVYPDAGNSGNTQKKYLIESVGTFGTNSVTLNAFVQQSSFGKYAYFTNTDPSWNYWVGGLTPIDGPMHSNNADGVETNVLWFDNAGTTKQLWLYNGPDAYTASASAIAWNYDSVGNMQAPSTSQNWFDVAVGGASTVSAGTPEVPMPSTNSVQANAALGTATAPTSIGVLVPHNGVTANAGIYIHGAIQNMTLSAPGGMSQQIAIAQTDSSGNPLNTTIVMNPATNQTTVTVVAGPVSSPTTTKTVYTGVTNGVVYADSSIGSPSQESTLSDGQTYGAVVNPAQGLSGVVADNYFNGGGVETHAGGLTIATDPSATVFLNGNITYNTQRPKTGAATFESESDTSDPSMVSFLKNAGQFGLVAGQLHVLAYASNGQPQVNYEIDGSTFVNNSTGNGTFDCENWNLTGYGNFIGMGGDISDVAGCFGVMSMSGVLQSGYVENHSYDNRLANTPPPYFPTTGSVYDILSWTQGVSTLQ